MHVLTRALLAAAALMAAGPAAAETNYYYCYARDYHGKELRYYTEIMSTTVEVDEIKTGAAYYDTLAAHISRDYPGDGSVMSKCPSSTNLATLRKDWARLPADYPGPKAPQIVAFANPPVPSQPVTAGAPGFHLTVEEVKPIGPTPDQLIAQVKAQREAERAQADRPAVDPAVFGVYSRLLGARVQGPKHSGLVYSWSRGEDGNIVQDRVDPDDRQHIRPDGPGRLLLVNNAGKAQQGRIEPDGSVVWHWPGRNEGVRFSIRGGQVVFEQVLVNRDGTVGELLATKVLQGRLPTPPSNQPGARAPGAEADAMVANGGRQANVAPASVQPTVPAAVAPQVREPNEQATAAVKGGGMPLRFILQVGLRTVINGSNASCYSNIITVPGPPGWPDPSRQQQGTLPARALVERYIDEFKAKCAAIAPLAGSVDYQWNMKGAEHISPEKTEAFARQKGFPFVEL